MSPCGEERRQLLATRRYRTIVADPPWPYPEGFVGYNGNPDRGERTRRNDWTLPYDSMTVDEIAALPVRTFCERNCRLFLWTTQRYLPDGLKVLSDWGFRYKQTLVWRKESFSPFGGSITANSAEFLIVAVMGQPPVSTRWDGGCVITAPGNHGGAVDGSRGSLNSRKPEVFLDLVEQVSPGPYLELFARRQRLGWDTWGDEALKHVELGA